MIWPIFWITVMLALVLATVVVAFREKHARAKAAKSMVPKDLDVAGDPSGDMGFGEAESQDAFGEPEDFAAVDEDAFK